MPDPENQKYACDPTTDKIFLLSQEELTNPNLQFVGYEESKEKTEDELRQKLPCDYAAALGCGIVTPHVANWWTRSPTYRYSWSDTDYKVSSCSNGGLMRQGDANDNEGGVVPALTVMQSSLVK